MLETLHIRDYALIEELEIEFGAGFNVLTGETGAGKSIVVGALGLALGARASSDTIRAGAQKAHVEVVFRLNTLPLELQALLAEQDIALEDNEIILSRTVAADGRSRALVNGHTVPIAVLAAIGDELVDLHGQHEHQSLLRPECQLRLLDAFASAEDMVAEVSALVGRLNKIRGEIERLESDDRERARQADFMRYELEEIDHAGLTPGEEEEQRERLHLITHAEKVHQLANEAHTALYESETVSAMDALNVALRDLEELAQIDAVFGELAAQLGEARVGVESVASELRQYTNRMEFDPEEINQLNGRLSSISNLKRKYGPDIEAILAYRNKTAAALSEYENRDAVLEQLRAEQRQLLAQAEKKAKDLSMRRGEAARKMDKEALRFLKALDMPNARFETRMEPTELGARGVDKITFMLSANAGEPLKPLRQVASGGEISRIMLALKAVFAEQDTVPTLVFDEIDAGIGGATARRVAETLADLSERRQVLCITHLAQLAGPAQKHFMVLKSQNKNVTTTEVTALTGTDREKEIARLLDGSVSPASLKHAKALLAEFRNA